MWPATSDGGSVRGTWERGGGPAEERGKSLPTRYGEGSTTFSHTLVGISIGFGLKPDNYYAMMATTQ